MRVEDLLGENAGEQDDANNVLTVAAMGNAALLEDLLRAGKDADVGDAKGRTALVSANYKASNYRFPNGPGTISGTRHDPKKHGSSPTRGTINSA
jgi:hypothetical protein